MTRQEAGTDGFQGVRSMTGALPTSSVCLFKMLVLTRMFNNPESQARRLLEFLESAALANSRNREGQETLRSVASWLEGLVGWGRPRLATGI